MRKVYSLILLLFTYHFSTAQIAQWTFETSIPATAGPHAAEVGTGSAIGLHASGSTAYSNPAGNGSAESFSSNFWAQNDYYQFQFPTTGYQNISITWDHTSSNTGPRDFKVQYSTDGSIFTDATGTNSTYVLTNDNWTSVTYNPTSTRTLDLTAVTALNNVPAVYIRLVCNSPTAVNASPIATAGSSRVDNFTVNGSAVSSNTITLVSVSTSPFNLTDCNDIETGTVDFTATGTFISVNTYSVELSDAVGVFAPGTVIGTFTSTANSGTITINIPAGTLSGTQYKMRIKSNNPAVTSNLSADITINQAGSCISSATDYFRSRATGNWDAITTWETSPDNSTWIPASLVPTSAANIILIRSPHTVTVAAAASADQVLIETGATLQHLLGAFTIEDGPGDDIDILSGAVLLLSTTGLSPTFGAGTPTINNNSGGIIRVSNTGLTGAGTGVNANNYVYQHQSILEYTPIAAFSTSNVTYFPNVSATTIPVFRTTNSSAITVGASAFPTVINGVFECNGADVSWALGADKTFRNGIRGTGNVIALATSGKFIINGQTAELGGTGGLTTPPAGLEIGSASGTTVAVSSNKTVTGDIHLLTTNTYVELGNFDLIVSNIVDGGSQTSYIRTNGTGGLQLNAVTARDFPVGNTSYNPVSLTGASGANYTVRVSTGISPTIAFPTYGINRTWRIKASSAGSTGASFQYAAADANAGAAPQPQPMEILQNDGIAWSVLTGNTNINPSGADPALIVTANVPLNIPTTYSPFALGIDGGFILPIDCIIACRSSKQNNNGLINWDVSTCSEVFSFEAQRAVNGGAFVTVGTIMPGNTLSYQYTDLQLAPGTNLYRIKIKGNNGAVKYSNTVAIINDTKGVLITAITPNPVTDQANVIINAAKTESVRMMITDIAGRPVRQWNATVGEGSNTVPVATTWLPNGIYHLSAITPESRTVIRFVKQ